MLQKETVPIDSYNLLKKLMKDKALNNFFLVGGTALSLQIGHRQSIDLDLFTTDNFNTEDLHFHLKENYKFKERYAAKNTLKGDIDTTFVDFIRYNYPILKPIKTEDSIRLASLEDISCMKLSVITDNGTRVKDFVDIAFLSCYFSLNNMLELYKEKYNKDNTIPVKKSLLFFDDINIDDEKVLYLKENIPFSTIKNRIEEMVRNPNKRFLGL